MCVGVDLEDVIFGGRSGAKKLNGENSLIWGYSEFRS